MVDPADFDAMLAKVAPDNPNGSFLLKSLIEIRAGQDDQALMTRLMTGLVMKYAESERQLTRLNAELREKQEHLDADLKAAAVIQTALLPKPLPAASNVRAAWKFVPCQSIGGDVFLLTPLGKRYLMVAIVDISGHGVPSAMVTVSVCQFLQPQAGTIFQAGAGPDGTVVPPGQVLAALDREFPYFRFKKTFSIFYGVLDRITGQFTYTNGGHPQPFLQTTDGALATLEEHGPIIGMGLGSTFPEGSLTLDPGSRLTFYSDGLTECRSPSGELFGDDRVRDLLAAHRDLPLPALAATIHAGASDFVAGAGFPDDFTLVHLEFAGPPAPAA